MAEKAALVDQIKNIQRSDPAAKQAWWDYCDSTLGGAKDPNRHEADVLQEFLALHSSGGTAQLAKAPLRHGGGGGGHRRGGGYGAAAYDPPSSPWASPGIVGYGGGCSGGGGGGGSASLSDFVKMGQRLSPSWKSSWQCYCALYGVGFFDPAKYGDNFITGFINYAGELALSDLGVQAAEQGTNLDLAMEQQRGGKGGKGTKRMAADAAGQPSAKRASTGGGWSGDVAAEESGDAEKVTLVSEVKALQRSNPDAKQAWWTFCDEALGGARDPNRHSADTLQKFLASIG